MSRKAILFTLILSCALNTFALIVPFIEVDMVFKPQEDYNLWASVVLMWEHDLYVLAIIITGFSVIFPFVKLAILFGLTLIRSPGEAHLRSLHVVEGLGKWSMIDVFIVCFILALSNDQIFVDAAPRMGLYAFMLAIILSMLCGTWLTQLWKDVDPPQDPFPFRPPLWTSSVLMAASAGWVCIFLIPFLEIHDWLMKDHVFTLVTFLRALLMQGAAAVVVVFIVGIVLMPLVEMILTWRLWFLMRAGGAPRWSPTIRVIRNWTMLNVFLVALIIFCLEGDELMTVKPGWGLVGLFLVLVADVGKVLLRRIWIANSLKKSWAHNA